MTLHPDVLADLVILYHAGEASQASRALLENEASRNPQVAAALASTARTMAPMPTDPAPDARRVLRRVRLRYQAISFGVVWTLALLVVALLPRLLTSDVGVGLTVSLLPFAVLALFFAGAAAVLYFFVRAVR